MKARQELSALDAAFLFFEEAGHRMVVGCLMELGGRVPAADLTARVDDCVRDFPRLRRRPIRSPLDLERPTWEEDPRFSLRRHVRAVAWPAPGDDQALRNVVEILLSKPLPRRRPPWEVIRIGRPSGERSAVLLRAHHCLLDGSSGATLLERLCDPEDGTWKEAPAGTGGARANAFTRRTSASQNGRHGQNGANAWERMRDVAELTTTCVSLLHDDPAPSTPLNGPLTDCRRIVWRTFPLDDLAALRVETRSTLNDVALAVICGALRRYLWRHQRAATRTVLRAIVPVSLRMPEETGALGNLLSAMFPRLPVHLADPLERLEWIARETRGLKDRGQPRATALLLDILGGMPPAFEVILPHVLPERHVFNTVCTNVRGPQSPRTLAGLPILALHAAVPLAYGMGAGFAVMTHAAQISICVTLDPSVVRGGDALIRDLDAALGDLLRANHQLWSQRHAVAIRGPHLRPPARYQPATSVAPSARSQRAARREGARHRRP